MITSCNGCRVLRKGCSERCVLRPCLQGIDSPKAQAHATLFLSKFFGRASLMSFISSVAESHRPALFRSLLLEACGRTVDPVSGVVGLMQTGNWNFCLAAVDTVLRGETIQPLPGVVVNRNNDAPGSQSNPQDAPGPPSDLEAQNSNASIGRLSDSEAQNTDDATPGPSSDFEAQNANDAPPETLSDLDSQNGNDAPAQTSNYQVSSCSCKRICDDWGDGMPKKQPRLLNLLSHW